MPKDADPQLALALLDFVRLERKRTREGLTVPELEERNSLNHLLNSDPSSGAERSGKQRRRSVRIPTKLKCRFGNLDSFEEALITNLSGGGIFIETSRPLPIESRLNVQINIDESNVEVEVPAVVVSNHVGGRDPTRRGMGLRFTEVLPEVLRQLDALYQSSLERHALEMADGEGDPRCPDAPAAGGDDPAGAQRGELGQAPAEKATAGPDGEGR